MCSGSDKRPGDRSIVLWDLNRLQVLGRRVQVMEISAQDLVT